MITISTNLLQVFQKANNDIWRGQVFFSYITKSKSQRLLKLIVVLILSPYLTSAQLRENRLLVGFDLNTTKAFNFHDLGTSKAGPGLGIECLYAIKKLGIGISLSSQTTIIEYGPHRFPIDTPPSIGTTFQHNICINKVGIIFGIDIKLNTIKKLYFNSSVVTGRNLFSQKTKIITGNTVSDPDWHTFQTNKYFFDSVIGLRYFFLKKHKFIYLNPKFRASLLPMKNSLNNNKNNILLSLSFGIGLKI